MSLSWPEKVILFLEGSPMQCSLVGLIGGLVCVLDEKDPVEEGHCG